MVVCPPTFGMYSVAARIQGAAVREVPLRRTGASGSTLRRCRGGTADAKLVFLCSPNNPTGQLLDEAPILELCRVLAARR